MDIRQFRDYIAVPALERVGAYSRSAEQLVMGTGLAESGLFFIQQIARGPAREGALSKKSRPDFRDGGRGFFQMEPATHDDIWENYLRRRLDLLNGLKRLLIRDMDLHDQLQGNLFYAAAMCRIHYMRFPEPLPAPGDWPGFAAYWKKYYNTPAGAGTIEGFLQKARPAMDL
jgi:hypothetical protein